MIDREKVIKGLECCMSEKVCHSPCPYNGECEEGGYYYSKAIEDAIALLKAQESITGETSDGYHTFNELYHHRAVLFSVIVANYPDRAWKSKKHHDGTMYNGMFIVGIDTPDGQATYHYDVDPYWDMFECRVLDNAPEWDGHTPAQAIERIGKLKAQEPRVMTLEEVIAHYSLPPVFEDDFGAREDYYEDIQPLYFEFPHDSEEPWIVHWRGHTQVARYLDEWRHSYNKKWRCWTDRPTAEQREAEPWES